MKTQLSTIVIGPVAAGAIGTIPPMQGRKALTVGAANASAFLLQLGAANDAVGGVPIAVNQPYIQFSHIDYGDGLADGGKIINTSGAPATYYVIQAQEASCICSTPKVQGGGIN